MISSWKALGRTFEIITIVLLVMAVGYLWINSESNATEVRQVLSRAPDAKKEFVERTYRPPPPNSTDTSTYQKAIISSITIDVSPPDESYQPQYQTRSISGTANVALFCDADRRSARPVPRTADSGDITQIKIATRLPGNTDRSRRMRAAADEIRKRTEDRVSLKYYFGGIQGSADKVLKKMQIGQLHGSTFSPATLQESYPDINIYRLPFIFESQDEVDYVRQRLDTELRLCLEEAGFVSFGFAGGGFAMILSKKPVRSHGDLKSKKVWVPEGDVFGYEALQALELAPVPLDIANVITGLQTGLIDIVVIPPAAAMILQWHTKVKYVTRMPIIFTMYFMVIDAKAFARMDAADQAIVREVMGRLYAELDAAEQDDAPNALQALINSGIESVEPFPGEFGKLQKSTAITNRSMADRGLFSVELYDELLMYLEEYHAAQGTVAGVP